MIVENQYQEKWMAKAPKMHDKRVLSRLQLFRNVDLNNRDVESLLDLCKYRELDPGEILLSTDRENHFLYVVVSGRCAIQLGPYEEVPLVTVDPGECVGEMSIIDNRKPSANVSATEPTVVMEIEKNILWRLISASHEVARNLLYIMSERVRSSNFIIADSMEMQRKYQRYATIDALSGLHNRGWMDDMFAREIRRADIDELPLCMIMIDVDNFKSYNDEYGHLAGDRVLVMLGETIRKPLRPNDLAARFGGEEFSVLLPETNLQDALLVAERLRKRIGETEPGELDGVKLPKVSVSLGLAEHRKGYTLEAMTAAADMALYQAKRDGKNCVRVAMDG